MRTRFVSGTVFRWVSGFVAFLTLTAPAATVAQGRSRPLEAAHAALRQAIGDAYLMVGPYSSPIMRVDSARCETRIHSNPNAYSIISWADVHRATARDRDVDISGPTTAVRSSPAGESRNTYEGTTFRFETPAMAQRVAAEIAVLSQACSRARRAL